MQRAHRLNEILQVRDWAQKAKEEPMSALQKWMILAVAIVALPACSFAQVQSRVDGRMESRVESRIPQGFGHHQSTPEQERRLYSQCWRVIRMPNGVFVLNCQPYPPL
jgi:hypothetical protein